MDNKSFKLRAQERIDLKIKRYDKFKQLLLVIFNSINFPENSLSLRQNLEAFIQEILIISEYMLITRFESGKRKEKVKRSEDLSDDLMKFQFLANPSNYKKSEEKISPLDVIKAFKGLEQFLYHENMDTELVMLEIGRFKHNLINLLRILPILLLESKRLDDYGTKQKVLSLIHSAICIYRQFSAKAMPDINTIIGAYSGNKSLEWNLSNHFCDEQIDRWLTSIPNLASVKEYFRLHIYSGNASSPAGGSHACNLLQDVNSIWRDFPIRDAIREIATHFKGGSDFILLVDNLFANTAWDKSFPITKASRIVTFTAPGAKARTIAIADWVSQTALSAIHFGIFQLLKLIESDRTFNHPLGLDLYRNIKESFYSLDLSAATDRLPRVLQARVLSRLFTKLGFNGDAIAKCWLTIIDREYVTRGSHYEKTASSVRYAVGNGMGLFSSWVSMALTHHYIVAGICGLKTSDYRLVGDDLLIRNNKASYEKYLAVMQDIGVGINLKKTIVSEDREPTIEFARNYIIDGVKINPLHFGVLFAWLDDNITSETVLWHIRTWLTFNNISEIMNILEVQGDLYVKMQVYYYIYRESLISEKEIGILLNSVSEFKDYSLDVLSRIKQVTASARLKITIKDKTIKGFYDTLLSQCIVRSPEELKFVVNFAQNIAMISFADDRLIEPAEKFHRRALDANIIRYDVDLKGGPLLTNRERNLIRDILVRDKLIKRSPPLKQKIAGKLRED